MLKPLITLFLCFLLHHIGVGQTQISGTITGNNSTPIIGARIMLVGTYDGALTNEEGHFEFTTEQTGAKELLIRFVGYEEQRHNIELNGNNITINAQLKERFNELEAVTISAGAFKAGDKMKSVTLSSIDMVTVPGASGNVIGALQFLPGTSTNGESGRLFVRGGNSRESQTYIDGSLVPVAYNPSAPNTAVRSKFNPFMFQGTVFSTGGFSAEYGQALSSVLLLETKGVQEEDQLDISILSVGLGLAGTKRWKEGAITASYDHTNLLPYLTIYPQDIDWVKTPIANNGALNFRQKTNKGLFKFYAHYNDAYFELNRPNLDNDGALTRYDLTNRNYYVNSSWKGALGKKWILKSGVSYTYNKDAIYIDTDLFTEQLNLAHFKSVFTRPINKKIKLNTGVELFSKHYQQNYTTDTTSFPFETKDIIGGAFAEANIYLSKKWVTRLGIRSEYSDYLNTATIAPRFSMAYQTSKNSQISLAAGRFYQAPEDKYLIYTDQVKNEYADQLMVNFQWAKNERTIRLEGYLKNYDDLVKFTDQPFYLPSHYTNDGHGYAQGVDFFFRDKKTIKNGDYWISYSYLNTKRNYLDFPELTAPSFAGQHNLSILYKHWIGKWRSLIGGSFNYTSPRSYNDPNSPEFNAEKMKAYQSLNLNWTYLHRENIIFYFSATNVLGYEQEFGYEFASTPNSQGIYEKRVITPPAPRFFIIGCFITLSKTGDKNQLDKIN